MIRVVVEERSRFCVDEARPENHFTNDVNVAVRSDCGKSDTNKFEPAVGKGPVARATLYFLLRYLGEINATSNEYTEDRLQVLLQWHKENPVTEYERHRNRAIFEVQGNRNPLTDHPEWAEQITFSTGLSWSLQKKKTLRHSGLHEQD